MRVFTGLTIVVAGMLGVANAARGQVDAQDLDASQSVVRIITGDMPLRETGAKGPSDTRLYSFSSSDGQQSHVLIMDKDQLSARPGDIALDIPKDQIKWVGLARRDWALQLLDGLSVDVNWQPHRGADRLIGLLDGGAAEGQLAVSSIDIATPDAQAGPADGALLPIPSAASRLGAGPRPSLMTGLYNADIWRLRPDMVLRQALARGATQILIDLPMGDDMSFPKFAIELRQFLQKAKAGGVAVWVRPHAGAALTLNDLTGLFAGIGAYNDLHGDDPIAGVYLPFIWQVPDREILSPDRQHTRFIQALTVLQRGNAGDLIVELPYVVWQALDQGQKADLEKVAQIGLVVREDGLDDLMQAKAQAVPAPVAAGGTTEDVSDGQSQINAREEISGTVLPRYRLVFRSLRPEAFARMTFTRGNPGRLHIYFQGEQAVILLLAAPAPAPGGNGFILDYLESPIRDADNYLGRETAMWMQAKRYTPTEFDFSQNRVIFMGTIVLEMD